MPFALRLSLALLLLTASFATAQDQAKLEEFFETKVRPVFANNCYSCHGPKKQQGGLRLDRRDTVLKPAEGEPVVIPGDPDKSALVMALRHQGEIKMPPKTKLPDEAIADITTWVKLGAVWPAEKNSAAKDPGDAARKHWAFRPVREPAVPTVKQAAWPMTPLDAFVLAKLEAKGLAPSPPADRRTLLRRLKFDLVGLPVTFDEVRAFETDPSPDAYARRVDEYLASPQYGERWARHWLDVARYADTKGYVFTEERRFPYSYTYRDYVVRAFNEDLPYDQFLVQQFAADRLVAAGEAPASAQAAMGYLTLGRRFLNNQHDIIDDRIDVVSRGLQGLTVACARCHDHKYDPIPTKDYYSLYGVFASSVEPKDLPLLGEPERTEAYVAFEAKLKVFEKDAADFQEKNKKELEAKNVKFRNELVALKKKADAFRATSPAAPPRAMILRDTERPQEPHVFLRGNPGNAGPPVPRQFLAVVTGPQRQPFKDGSGRLELARAITSPDNPLTARVLVNRVWLHHFGAGLVTTPSDFGLRSDPPSHPELLDYLGSRFMAEGWSLKTLHRAIVLSATYQLSSADHPAARAADPENRLLAHANRRRLDFEALRDALLVAGDHLDARFGGPGVMLTSEPFTGRRTLYGFVERQNLPGIFRTFDFANPDVSNPQRFQTTVPQQALYLLNNRFVHDQARALLQRPEIVASTEPAAKVRALYRLILARNADDEEVRVGVDFVTRAAATPTPERGLDAWERYGQALLVTNEFVFVD